jgi:PAS domain S-box-containing protein
MESIDVPQHLRRAEPPDERTASREVTTLTRLVEAQARLAAIVDSSDDAIIGKTLDGIITSWNRGAEGIFGYSALEAVGRHIFLIIPEDRRAEEEDVLSRLRRGEKIDHFETERRTKDGRRVHISLTVSPIKDDRGVIVGASKVARDITLQKQTEDELSRASKLESIGVLAGGIAHDFNNILTALIGNLALAKMALGPDNPAVPRLVESEKAVWRARSLTNQLLTFSRGGQPIKRVTALGQTLRESADFALQGSTTRCEFSLPDDLWPVEADAGQLSQVIHNIVLNAQQAMPQGGTVRLEAANETLGPETRVPLSPGQYVGIRVTDHGVGIAPEHLAKVFDPFFTTRPKGSGLGLATAYMIVKRHGGQLTVESEPGRGSTFSFYLPRAHGTPAVAPTERFTRGTGRILLMDDDAPIRDFACEALQRCGYEVECAQDGVEAIERFHKARAASRPFNAVILDLTVRAGMGGAQAVTRIREADPAVPIIVSSGYSNDPVLSNFKAHGFSGMLPKPYTVETLSQVLASLSPAGID